jgi:hypothetical protein
MIPIQFSKEAFKYLGWVLLFTLLYFRGCSSPSLQLAKVTVPEVKGIFEAKKPTIIPIRQYLSNGKIITIENPINAKLLAENINLQVDFANANDSIKKLQYANAIQLNKFSSIFEDDNIKIDINGIVQGEVKEVSPSYIIKSKTIEVPVIQKETAFRLLGGLEVGNNTKLDAFSVKANLMFQNRKGNILSASFDTNQNIWIGYSFSIFNIKR